MPHATSEPSAREPSATEPSATEPCATEPCATEVIEPLWAVLPDGTRLAGKLWRPAGGGAHPVILEYLPYRLHDGTRTRDQGIHQYLASFGYASLRIDMRGMGNSDGLLHDEYSEQELQDGVDLISWIAAQPWCDGQVAMIGISWGGFNGLQIAARQPAALKTVITVGSTDDRYATDVHYVGGCLSKDNFDWSATMLAQNDLPPDPAVVGEGWREMWRARMEANTPWAHLWFRHQRRDGYWRHGSICEDFSAVKVPVYAVSGWADNYSEAVPRLMAGLSGPRRGLVGPWAHSYPHDVTVEPAIGWLQEVLRWCDHWMKGRPTGIMDEPMLRVWMEDSVPPRSCYTEKPGRWVGEPVWPSPRIREVVMPLGAGGGFDGAPGRRQVCSPLWVGLTAGEVGRYGGDADWPADQRIDDAGSLVWTGEALPARLEILGAARVRLRVAADRPLALVALRLCDVAPNGESTRVALGLLNLAHRGGHDAPEVLEPGWFYDVEVELDDIAHSFAPGHRISLGLSSAYYPIAWPSPELVTLVVEGGALVLPVRPERAEDAALRAFDPPASAPQTPHRTETAAATHVRRVTQDLLSGVMTVDFPRWTYAVVMEDIGQTVRSAGHVRHLITNGDPLSAVTETGYEVVIERADATVGHRSTGRLSCDATHFRLETELWVTENGEDIYHRRWDERIARDHV